MIPAHEQRLRAERDAAVAEAAELRAKHDKLFRQYTEVAQALGMTYEADYRDPHPAPHEEVLDYATKCFENAALADEWEELARRRGECSVEGCDEEPNSRCPKHDKTLAAILTGDKDMVRALNGDHGPEIADAIDALHAAGILTFGTLAQGVEKLAGERDAAKAETDNHDRALGEVIDEREAMEERVNLIAGALDLSERDREWSNVNDVGARCVERAEELLSDLAEARAERDALLEEEKRLRLVLSGKTMFCAKCGETERALADLCRTVAAESVLGKSLSMLGLWRDPAPARADDAS